VNKNDARRIVNEIERYLGDFFETGLVVQALKLKGKIYPKHSYGISLYSSDLTLKDLYFRALSALQNIDETLITGGCTNISLDGLVVVSSSININSSKERVEELLNIDEDVVQIQHGDVLSDPEFVVHNQIRRMLSRKKMLKYSKGLRRQGHIFIGGYDSIKDAAFDMEEIVKSQGVIVVRFIDTKAGSEIDEDLWPGRYWVYVLLGNMELDEDSEEDDVGFF